jgi:hypothetical protein
VGRWKPKGGRPTGSVWPAVNVAWSPPRPPIAPPNGEAIPYADRDPVRCFRGACYALLPADGGWYNRGTDKHYCERCARLINYHNRDAVPPLCSPPSPEIPE